MEGQHDLFRNLQGRRGWHCLCRSDDRWSARWRYNTGFFRYTDRSGYTFTGWQPSVAATVTDNAVYTAQWAKNSSSSHHSTRYTLHYESNGGTAYKDERCSSGTKVTLDKTPTRESYTFTGWYADKR